MESINSVKNRFLAEKKEAEYRLTVKDYQGAMPHLEKAAELLGEVYRRDINVQRREQYKRIREELRDKYDECKQELGMAPSSSSKPRQSTQRPAGPRPAGGGASQAKGSAPAKGGDRKGKGKQAEEDDGINYVVNGIDLKQFLASESREKDVMFDDVIGMEREKRTVKGELFLSEEEKAYKAQIGLKNKNFILLYGLPGTGKTYFAMALSNELREFSGEDIPFFSVVCTHLKSSHVGQTENNIIALFEFTKQFDRCVLFMDEFDAIGQSRQKNSGDPTAVTVVNTLLTQLGGFDSNPNLLFIAATNCPYNLDGALLSRASPKIEVPLPGAEVLYGTLKRKLGDLIAPDVDLSAVANRLAQSKFSNRDASNLIDEIKRKLFEAHRADDMIDKVDSSMITTALKEVKSSVKRDEEIALEEFKAQFAEN